MVHEARAVRIVKATGADLSITGTGVCYGEDKASDLVLTSTIKTVGTKDNRLMVIAREVLNRAEGSAFVLIEGFLNKSMSAGITGMVHGAVRLTLLQHAIPYGSLPPASLKKYATGSGNASKTDMALAAFKRGGREFKDDNQCDAWWLWVAAMDHLGSPVFDLPKVQREALSKIKMES